MYLLQCRLQRAPIPQADVVKGFGMCGGIKDRIRQSRFEWDLFDTIKCKSFTCEFNIVFYVRPLPDEFIRTHDEGPYVKWRKAACHKICQCRHRNGHTQITNPPGA